MRPYIFHLGSLYQPDTFSPEDGQILQTFAHQAALAIHNARLFENLRRYERIVSATTDGVSLVDRHYVYQIVNQVYLDLSDKAHDQIVGHSVKELLSETVFQDIVKDRFDRTLNGEVIQYQDWFEYKTKGRRFMSVTYAPYQESDGSISGIVATSHDLTELKQLEDRLVQSQRMEAVSQLAAGVAHHFNNLLTGILGYVSLARLQLPPDHPVVTDLNRAQESIHQAATLTRQLLTFTRKQIIQPQILNLNELILTSQGALRRLLNPAIELKISLTPELDPVKLDVNQAEQLLFNLAANARDAMPQGGRLTLETANTHLNPLMAGQYELPPGDYVRLTVSDTGTGMSDAVKSHLFEPFFTTKAMGQGTGLGLPTCFGIVKQHNGHITVQSQPDQGATFKIYLPRYETSSTPASHSPADEFPTGTETILVVEDEATVRKVITRLLHQQGYTILEAENGGQALQVIAGHPTLHLLLTDVIMPHLDGGKLAAKLRAVYPNLKVLFISGYADEITHQSDLLELAAGFLAKPFTPAVLLQKVRAILDEN